MKITVSETSYYPSPILLHPFLLQLVFQQPAVCKCNLTTPHLTFLPGASSAATVTLQKCLAIPTYVQT